MLANNNYDTTLEILENNNWDEAPSGATNLIRKCHQLRRKQLKELEVEDIRLLIGQQIGLPYLVPMALEVLAEDILAEGDLYEGDLLTNVIEVSQEYWKENPDQLKALFRLYETNQTKIERELKGSTLSRIRERYENLIDP